MSFAQSTVALLIILYALVIDVDCTVELLSKDLADRQVTEGDTLIFNCTVKGRMSDGYRISWNVDWTPANNIADDVYIFAEINGPAPAEDVPSPPHGTYTLTYRKIVNGDNEVDAIHMCLLTITGITLDDSGKYRCTYFHPEHAQHILLRGHSNVFVYPDRDGVPHVESTTPQYSTEYEAVSKDNSGTIAAVTVVLFLIIITLISIWAVYRYRRYRKDKKAETMEIPVELPKTEAGTNSYNGHVVGNGTTVTDHQNTETAVTPVDDVAGVRMPPMMTDPDPPTPAYSLLNRPDSEIRSHLGETPYDLPPAEGDPDLYDIPPAEVDASNADYVLTTIGENSPVAPTRSSSRPSSSANTTSTPGYEVADINETEPSPPNRSVSRQRHSSYEIVSPNDFIQPPAPDRSSSRQSGGTDNLAYMDDVSGNAVYDDVPNPDTQL